MADSDLDLQALGRAITRRRTALGWKTNHLAERADLSETYVRKVERGQGQRVGIEVLTRLAREMGVTVDDFLYEAGVPTARLFADELGPVYRSLANIERRALLRSAQSLRELQAEYAALQADVDDERPHAAYDRELPPLEDPAGDGA